MAKSPKKEILQKPDDDTLVINLSTLALPASIMIGSIIISVSILIGLKGVTNQNIASTTALNVQQQVGKGEDGVQVANVNAPQQQAEKKEVTVSLDNNPILGEGKPGTVAIVEFSDYECPFCKRHRTQTQPQIYTKYIKNGLVSTVFRDNPLPFHEPKASEHASAANCVFNITKSDAKFFTYSDRLFKDTKSNGTGLPTETLIKYAQDLGVKESDLQTCMKDQKTKDEIAKDMSDARALGLTGTPGFVIGIINDDGTVTGKIVEGALPFSEFARIIDSYL